jgi:hypothetical protein
MSDHPTPPAKGWWITPVLCLLVFIVGVTVVWQVSEIGRELLAKSFMTIAGYLATPFILETSAALFGLVVVLVYNEWRRGKDGPDWVEMEITDDKAPELKTEADTAAK